MIQNSIQNKIETLSKTMSNVTTEKGQTRDISVIIPFSAGRHFLLDCFDSLAADSLSHVETILICDHNKENIDDIIKDYKTKLNLNVIILKDKTGVAAARNAGIDASKGKYLYFLDSDDYIYNNTIEKLLSAITYDSPDIVYGAKKSTWFHRNYFLETFVDKESKDEDQFENDDSNDNKEKTFNMSEGDEPDTYHGILHENYVHDIDNFFNEAEMNEKNRRRAIHDLIRKRKGLKNISVLNILFRRDLITEHNIYFQEEFQYYVDLSFVIRTLSIAKSYKKISDSIYVKRKHNDPINFPAISQIKSEDRFDEFINSYKTAQSFDIDADIRKLLDKKVINYYANYFATRLRRSEYSYWKEARFTSMQKIINEIDKNTIHELSGYKKRIIKALLQGNVKKSLFIVNMHLGLRKIKKIRKNKRVFGYYLYFNYFLKLPIKNNVVLLESFFGKSYSDSPKYIYEYLNKTYPGKYKYVWVMNKKSKIPHQSTKVKRFSIRYMYYLARSRYFVYNGRQPEWVRKRENTTFLQTWHGTPLKKLVFDQESVSSASPLYKQQFYNQSRIWDYLVSDNQFSTETFKRAFKFDNEIIESGYPRNDILYSPNKEQLINHIKSNLNIDKTKKVILYAPTWRDDEYYGPGQYKFALKMDLHRMKESLGNEYVLLLRTHYFIADALDVTGLEDFAVNVSKYDDISELYLISDILITDYSSVFFDYANLKRPILFYTYDLEKYRDMLRGFYLDIENEVPGPLLLTDHEVIDAIKNIDDIEYEYRDKYKLFYDRFCNLDDGNASKRIVERVFND
jgi:CDP-glycerol glycerophosphotransferase